MTPFWSDGIATVYHGDARTVADSLTAESVQLVVTSPPYFGLRKYAGVEPTVWGGDKDCAHSWQERAEYHNHGDATAGSKQKTNVGSVNGRELRQDATCEKCGAWLGCLGLEPTPQQFIRDLIEVFRHVRRVMRKDALMLVNIGDSYSGSSMSGGSGKGTIQGTQQANTKGQDIRFFSERKTSIPAKSAICIPDRLRLALIDDGWIVRVRSVPWLKRSCMPGSQTDRPTVATEDWIMLSKGQRYYWDADAVRREHVEPWRGDDHSESHNPHSGRLGDLEKQQAAVTFKRREYNSLGRALRTTDAYFDSLDALIATTRCELAHWERIREQGGLLLDGDGLPLALDVVAKGSDRQHYAAFCEGVVTPWVLGGTSEMGCCAKCGAPWERVTDVEREPSIGRGGQKWTAHTGQRDSNGGLPKSLTLTLGWRPTCSHDAERVPCVVYDPFLGSGSTAVVAKKLGRHVIGSDASAEYCQMSADRLSATDVPLPEIAVATPSRHEQLALLEE